MSTNRTPFKGVEGTLSINGKIIGRLTNIQFNKKMHRACYGMYPNPPELKCKRCGEDEHPCWKLTEAKIARGQ